MTISRPAGQARFPYGFVQQLFGRGNEFIEVIRLESSAPKASLGLISFNG
ncbi:MAG: hypothetical protein O7E57_16355 [Gammaproteobacteria bacterium]|nr:hypothetical protein [Gammaproteobacteria bacterium]